MLSTKNISLLKIIFDQSLRTGKLPKANAAHVFTCDCTKLFEHIICKQSMSFKKNKTQSDVVVLYFSKALLSPTKSPQTNLIITEFG